jgi:hypothetical protein
VNEGRWYVLVEEHVQHFNYIRWDLSQAFPAPDMEQALQLAHHVALNHVGKHPRTPRSRALFRGPDGSWLVNVHGATTRFHFRVTVAEYYGTYPGVPSA